MGYSGWFLTAKLPPIRWADAELKAEETGAISNNRQSFLESSSCAPLICRLKCRCDTHRKAFQHARQEGHPCNLQMRLSEKGEASVSSAGDDAAEPPNMQRAYH
jgi:hypothetical protein